MENDETQKLEDMNLCQRCYNAEFFGDSEYCRLCRKAMKEEMETDERNEARKKKKAEKEKAKRKSL